MRELDPFATIEVSSHALLRARDRRLGRDELRIREDVRGAILLGRVTESGIEGIRSEPERGTVFVWPGLREIIYIVARAGRSRLVVVTVLSGDRPPLQSAQRRAHAALRAR